MHDHMLGWPRVTLNACSYHTAVCLVRSQAHRSQLTLSKWLSFVRYVLPSQTKVKVVHGCEDTLAETCHDGVLANRVSPSCSQKRIESSELLLLEDGLRFRVKAL